MNNVIYKLDNVTQNYVWGSRSVVANLFSISNPDNLFEREYHSYTHFIRIEFAEEALNLAS